MVIGFLLTCLTGGRNIKHYIPFLPAYKYKDYWIITSISLSSTYNSWDLIVSTKSTGSLPWTSGMSTGEFLTRRYLAERDEFTASEDFIARWRAVFPWLSCIVKSGFHYTRYVNATSAWEKQAQCNGVLPLWSYLSIGIPIL